jgi:hypothetical protein
MSFATSTPSSLKITDPVATSTLAAGQQSTVTWQDDGTAPSLATFGLASIGLYVGTQSQQVCSLTSILVLITLTRL